MSRLVNSSRIMSRRQMSLVEAMVAGPDHDSGLISRLKCPSLIADRCSEMSWQPTE